MNTMPNPFHPDESRFVLDEAAFMNDIEPLPAFLVSPGPKYLEACEIVPILEILAGDSTGEYQWGQRLRNASNARPRSGVAANALRCASR